jgi:replicative DNA helicase
LWSPPEAIRNVLEFVHDDDLENPTAAVVLSAIRTLAATSQTAGPQLVLDEVRREGRMKPAVAEQLWRATLSGAESAWRKEYGGAVLAESLRRRVESFGVALVSASREAAEPDLAPLVTRAAETVRDCAERLAVLRGEN